MKKFFLILLTLFFAYFCAFITSGSSEKQGLFGSDNSLSFYKFFCALTGATDTTDANQLFYRGDRYLIQREYELAIKDMKKVLEKDSSYSEARFIMAKAYLGLGDTMMATEEFFRHSNSSFEPASSYLELGYIFKNKSLTDSGFYFFKKAHEANNSLAEANFEIATYYFSKDSLDQALEYIDKVIKEIDDDPDYRNFRRKIYLKQRRYELAEQDYLFILSNNPSYYSNFKEIAAQEKSNGNYQGAIENYKLALSDQIDNRELLEARAWVYHSLARYDSALMDFNRVLELYPDYLSYFNVAYTFDLLNQIKESIEHYDKSIELKGDYNLSYNNRGYEHYRLKDFKKAEADYTMSILLKSDYSLPLNNRGLLYYELGRYPEAIEDFRNALKYDDNPSNTIYSLALAYDAAKNKQEAINTYNEFLKLANEGDSIKINHAVNRISELNNLAR